MKFFKNNVSVLLNVFRLSVGQYFPVKCSFIILSMEIVSKFIQLIHIITSLQFILFLWNITYIIDAFHYIYSAMGHISIHFENVPYLQHMYLEEWIKKVKKPHSLTIPIMAHLHHFSTVTII